MSYDNMVKLRRVIGIAIFLYVVVIYFVYQDNKRSEIENEKTNIEDVLIQIKAIRKYVSNDQKDEIYELQHKGILTHDYFSSPLLSSTYSANKINEYYNEMKKERNMPTTDIRFASPNPRNPKNLATKEEEKILNSFMDNEKSSYQEIRDKKGGKVLYIALPTRKLEAKCMRCHDTPENAPKQLVDKYGDSAGFGEKEGNMKAIMSIERPLNNAYARALNQTLKTAFYIFIATSIFIFFYYNFNKKIYIKNLQLKRLNKNLDEKVKERTEELHSSQTQLLNVINSSYLGYWDWDIENDKLHVNRLWHEMLGLDENEFDSSVSSWFKRIYSKDYEEVESKIIAALKEDLPFNFEFRMKHKDKEYIWIECIGGVVQRDSNNKAIQACGIIRDINQRKQNEQKVQEQKALIHNQAKVAAIAEMLKNISHQWKQPLSAITSIASSIKLSYKLNREINKEEIIAYSDKITDYSNYLAKIINDFSSYFDNNLQTKERCTLDETFDKLDELFSESKKEQDIQCHIKIDKELHIYINENFFIQAILNLFNNSLDAFINNNIEREKRHIFVKAKSVDSNIVIEFKDSAGGIKKDIIEKIFEPYFTTKHQSLGTGLGLYMTNQIIVNHLNGTIEARNSNFTFENTKLKGARFIITLPKTK